MRKQKYLSLLFLAVLAGSLSANSDISNKPEIISEVSNNLYYGVSINSGFLKSTDGGKAWTGYNRGLPPRMVYPFTDKGVKMLTSLAYDVKNPSRILVSTPREIYLSQNGGDSWDEIRLKYPFKYSNYIISLALNPLDSNSLVLGTSFSGIYETKDHGKSWVRISEAIPELYRGAGFYEEITALALSPYDDGLLYYLCGPTGELYYSARDRKTWVEMDLPFGKEEQAISMNFVRSGSTDSPGSPAYVLEITTDRAVWTYNPERNWWWKKSKSETASYVPDPAKKARLAKASGKYGIYISSWHAADKATFEKLLQFVKDHGMNSIVVDMKDDNGYLTYNSNLETARQIGSISNRFRIEDIIKEAHDKGIYVIGRLPVFKDAALYKYEDGKYALHDKNTGGTWGYKKKEVDSKTGEVTWKQLEYWVDPYSEFVCRYNVAIAKELQDRGIDEVQFDYIRFPTDGDLSSIKYNFARPGMLRIEALESFLAMAREKVSIPLSTDLYGFNSWYRMGNWNGQNIEMVSHYVDVISPMYYPSHFPGEFMKDLSYLDRAEEIYKQGSRRAAHIVGKRSIIRPYIQAFLMGPELKMGDDEYTMYLNRQVKGSEESSASGFSLWNASNRYYMVSDSIQKYF